MSMKTRSQHGSDNEISDGNPPTPPEITADVSATAPVIASIEVDETSQAFTDALDRALLRLMGSRDDAAKVPAVYATGDIAARTDQPYSDQSSSRNPLDRSSATTPTQQSRRSRTINDLMSTGSLEKNLSNDGYRGNPRKNFSTRRENDDDSSSEGEDNEPTSQSDRRRKNKLKLSQNELHDASRKSTKKSDKSSRQSSRKSSNKTSNNDNVDSPRNEADLVSGSIGNNNNDGKVDSNSNNNKKKSSSRKTSHKKGYPSDSSDEPSESSQKSKGNARRIPQQKKKSTDSPDDLSSSSSDSSSCNHKSSCKDHSSSSSDTEYKKKKRKYNRRVKKSK